MKRIPTYILIISLLLSACRKEEEQPASNVVINELMVRSEQMTTTKAYTQGEITEFETNDSIRVFGFFKAATGDPATRFMPPIADVVPGATYVYERDVNGWHRFLNVSDAGAWRSGFYHDFTAYFLVDKPATNEVTYTMTATGLPPKELLWGETKDVPFSGDAQVIPRITFKHQLSRIRITRIHDLELNPGEVFNVINYSFKLDGKTAVFNVETGTWSGISAEDVLLSFGLNEQLHDGNRLEDKFVTEFWVLPDRTITDFEMQIEQEIPPAPLQLKTIPVTFKGHTNPTADIETKAGYVSTLRVEIGNLKPIVFTVSLEPWTVEKKTGEIKDPDPQP